jgi:hypothetical protein
MARDWKLSERKLAMIAKVSVKRANPARFALDALVRDRSVAIEFPQHRQALTLVRRALAVPLTPVNRKGAMPTALGLVSRADRGRAIMLALERVFGCPVRDRAAACPAGECARTKLGRSRRRWECPANGCRQTFIFPKDFEEAAQAVVEGFYESGLDRTLSVSAVQKLWQRWRSKHTRSIASKTTTR